LLARSAPFVRPTDTLTEHRTSLRTASRGVEDQPWSGLPPERRIAEVENNFAQERTKTGRHVLGRRRILRQAWRDSPDSHEPRRNLRPRFAGQDPATRFALIERNRQWRACYANARAAMLAGEQTQFPYGTYWLRRFMNVTVTPPPEFT